MSTTDVARRVRTHVRARPKLALAVKAALAAMLAWLLVRPLGSFATEYSYYAPLGALTVVSTSIAVSVRSSFEVVIGILLGAGIALAVQVVPLPEPLPLGLAVVVGSLVGASGVAGAMSGWVPLAAMFVMIAGRGDPVGYTAAYGGLTALGALVGVAVAKRGGDVRVAVTGAGSDGVFRWSEAEAALKSNFSAGALDGLKVAASGLNGDIHGSAEYRAHLIGVMARRAVAAA